MSANLFIIRLRRRCSTNFSLLSTTRWLRPKAQGCCTQLPWETNAMFLATPNGVAAALRMEGLMNSIPIRDNLTRPADGGACRNPVWLGNAPTLPQDSRVRQPWRTYHLRGISKLPETNSSCRTFEGGSMQYGFVVDGWDLRTIGDLTEAAEEAGW